MATTKRIAVGMRDKLTNAATSFVLSLDPMTPCLLSKINLTTFLTIKKMRKRIRITVILMSPKITILFEMERKVSLRMR
jgi:hypothetical protein